MIRRVKVPDGYRCPFCPDHRDDTFYFTRIVGAPICEGCDIDLSNFVEDEERPDDPLLDRLEALTGLSFREYRRMAFEETIEDFERRLRPENVRREAAVEMLVTGRSLDEVTKGWKKLIAHYRAELERLTPDVREP